jgi:hypothetical protein
MDNVIDVGRVGERAANGTPDVASVAVIELSESTEVSADDVLHQLRVSDG